MNGTWEEIGSERHRWSWLDDPRETDRVTGRAELEPPTGAVDPALCT